MTPTTMDGVRLAVLTNRLQGVVRAMMNTLFRTGRSGVLNTAHDFSCCILTAGGDLVVAAESVPVHVVGADLAAEALRTFHRSPQRGDAYLHNSPYHGNSHPADHVLLVPIVDDDGVHRFTALVKAHQADIGNALPTTYSPTAKDVYEEGALIFPMVKVQHDYTDDDDWIRLCELRIRVPEQWRGDYLAMVGAARTGERRILELAEEIGWDTLDEYAEAWFDYGERRMTAAIEGLPAGHAEVTVTHDPAPGMDSGIPITSKLSILPADGVIEVDLTDNPDCLPNGLNLTKATARAAALIGVFNSIDHTVPPNAGSFRRVRIALRENCCVGIPRHPASCSVATTNLADCVANGVQRALAELADGIGMAESGREIPAAAAVISGVDPRSGRPFVNEIFLGYSGGQAGPHADGWLTLDHVGNAGMLRRDSIEVDEIHHPILVFEERLIPDSEGAGRFRGTPSVQCEYGPLGCDLTVAFASDGCVNPPAGARGGGPSWRAAQWRRTRDGHLEDLDAWAVVEIRDGERIVSRSTGSGGYGPPWERDVTKVAQDVAEGWVSRERAADVYGVALDASGAPDPQATQRLRAALAGAGSPGAK